MKLWQKGILALLAIGLVGGAIALACMVLLELRWKPQYEPSAAMLKNHMHVATLLLQQRGHTVDVVGTLDERPLEQLSSGTLLMANGFGQLSPAKAARLLAWVERGNTLITQPRWISEVEAEAVNAASGATAYDASAAKAAQSAAASASASAHGDDDDDDDDDDGDYSTRIQGYSGALSGLTEPDPISLRFGVRHIDLPPSRACVAKRKLQDARNKGKEASSCPAPIAECDIDDMRYLVLPGASHQLELETWTDAMVSLANAPAPQWSDAGSNTVRIYAHGKGKVVMLATNYFANGRLQKKDHAELLLGLTALAGANSHVTLVQFLHVLPWYELLWARFQMLLLGLAALLALALWAALRRFGPLLPAPTLERRSLMEHIDASGAWLWKNQGGNEVLLQAARADTLALVRRRAPGLLRLSESEPAAALAQACQLPLQQVHEALYGAAGTEPIAFARQIQILQTLRNHHER